VAAEAFTPRALEALFRACQDGWSIYLIGNEEDVALGKLSDARWEAFERELLAFLGSYGVRVQRNYACLDDPLRGKGRHKRDSVYLLPNTGAMYHARQHDGVDLQKSWVIGDGVLELVAGWRAGCRLAGVGSSGRLEAGELAVEPELFRPDLASVLAEVLRPER
jgi:histidinol phosphatase-like enzyme